MAGTTNDPMGAGGGSPNYSLDDILPILAGALEQSRMQGMGSLWEPGKKTLPISGTQLVNAQQTRKGQLAAGIGSLIGNVLIANKNMDNPLGLPWWLGGHAQGAPGQGGKLGGGSPIANRLAAPMSGTPASESGLGRMGGGGGGGISQAAGTLGSLYASGALGGTTAAATTAAAAPAAAAAVPAAVGAGEAAAGAGAGAYAALLGLFCWVAEELFGSDHPDTWLARLWCAAHPRHPFVRLYGRHGRAWAAWLHEHPWARPMVAPVWRFMAWRGASVFRQNRAALEAAYAARQAA